MAITQPPEAFDLVAKNLKLFLEYRKLSPEALAQKSGVGVRTIKSYLGKEKSPTVTTLYLIAKGFKVPMWYLLVPDMPIEMLKPTEKFMRNYVKAPQEGKRSISLVAETVAKYGKEET